MPALIIHHRVSIPAPATHLVHVESTISKDGESLPESLVLFMPVWTPGSYLVREYARHIEGFQVAPPSRAAKIRKNAWRIDTQRGASIIVRYRLYAAELTVRTSHIDETHAFLVGAAVFLGVEGHGDVGATIELETAASWRIATPLSRVSRGSGRLHRLEAPDFETLVDSPIELGTHLERTFDVLGIPHRYAICPLIADEDAKRLVDDTKTIVEVEASLFGGSLPYESYDLLLHLSPRGRGGLEHSCSAALIAPQSSFATREGYLDLLSLIAHEVFHAWNIKRIRPAGLTPYRYDEECYTRLLWWFEGATSYYDWRVLALSRLCSIDEYLEHFAGELAYLDQTQGRLVQSLEDASFDAWIKLYRPDENSSNSGVSYYRKGEIVCALLDIELRARTGGATTLDTTLKHLWDEYGRRARPIPEEGMQAIFEDAAGTELGDLFDAWIRTPTEIDYGRTLARVGLAVERSVRTDAPRSSLGVRVRADGGRSIVAAVTRDTAAWRAGIDVGDEIVAVGATRVEAANLDPALRDRAPGESVDVLVSRDGRLTTKSVTLDAARLDRVRIVPMRDATPPARGAFEAWMRLPLPAAKVTGAS
ncbi:MAG TPA: PDZ domain-containing protein [Polyangiaceae bacterium]|nr:PDZ domain-containing protein [Polyangiaceae bacterium]